VTSEEINDSGLLALARAGEPEAFGELFDRHRDRVFRHALRAIRSAHDAEDVTGIVFLEAWRRRESIRDVNGSIVAWLLATANNVIRNYSRSARRYRHVLASLPIAADTPDHSHAVNDRLDFDEQRDALRAALSRLPRRDQEILSLCVIEQLSTADVAAALRIAPGTVKSRLSRAKGRLAALLDDPHQLTSTEGGLS